MGLRFLLDGQTVELDGVDASDTLLDYLRYRLRRTGTKEGCAEGDCGACTVLVGTPDAGGGVVWRAVNSCILLLPMLQGKALMTVESLSENGGATPQQPTPLQHCMAENGSSQCGFCTPGFVMSLHGRAIGAVGCDLPVADALAGNLCRCTGYGPILAAGEAIAPRQHDDSALAEALRQMRVGETLSGGSDGRHWFIPQNSDALATLLGQHPDARLVAGATDVGLWVTKRLQVLEKVIFIGDIADLDWLREDDAGLTLGAGLRYADAHAAFARLHPDLGELTRRIGGLQVRNAGTVGGNIANGSPIGDGPPALITLGARLVLRSAAGRRELALEDYFLDYGKQDRRPGEFVESLTIPRPAPGDLVQITKLSRRFDSDISAVCGAFKLTIADGLITAARIAFGGMAATPRRAVACEAALIGQRLDSATIARAAEALSGDFTPLNDVRGSAEYRLQAAAGLLWRLWHKAQGHAVSVLDVAAYDSEQANG